MADRFDLIDDRFVDLWVGVTDAHRQHATEAIEILVAFIIPDVRALAFHQGQRLLVVSGDSGKEKFLVFADGFGWCGSVFSSAHVLVLTFRLTLYLNDTNTNCLLSFVRCSQYRQPSAQYRNRAPSSPVRARRCPCL